MAFPLSLFDFDILYKAYLAKNLWINRKYKVLIESSHFFYRILQSVQVGSYGNASGHAVAQAVSRWLPTAATRVRVRAACGVFGGQSGIGAGFLQVLQFPLPIIPPISPSS
jgi:hypothetical protein